MEGLNQLVLVGAALLLAALVLGALSARAGFPLLLVFLVVGMLAGEDGPGGIVFNGYVLSALVGNVALAVILLDGGLRTRVQLFRVALRPALALATAGVVMTAALVGAFAAWLLGLDWRIAALLGAIVGSTDAASVFGLLKTSGVRLGERVEATLELESGANDPMAVFLTVALIQLLTAPAADSPAGFALELARQFGIGAGSGIALGFVAARLVPRARLGPGLDTLLACAAGVTAFGATNLLGGSGFLAVYLFGIVLGNAREWSSDDVLRSMDGLAWLAQSVMFLLLGLLVTPRELPGVLGPALAVAAFLMVVARPAAVWACLAPFGFRAGEVWYIAWMGLRGAVPIVLAIFPLLAGVADAKLLFNVAFVVVLASLLLQGTTVSVAARWLRVDLPARPAPLVRLPLAGGRGRHELLEFDVENDSPVCGTPLEAIDLPRGARAVSVMRVGEPLAAEAAGALAAGDIVTFIAPEQALARLEDLFLADAEAGAASRRRSFGELFLDADARLGEVLALYGEAVPAGADPQATLAELFARTRRARPVEGDSLKLGVLELTVAEVEAGRIVKVGLRLPRRRPG